MKIGAVRSEGLKRHHPAGAALRLGCGIASSYRELTAELKTFSGVVVRTDKESKQVTTQAVGHLGGRTSDLEAAVRSLKSDMARLSRGGVGVN